MRGLSPASRAGIEVAKSFARRMSSKSFRPGFPGSSIGCGFHPPILVPSASCVDSVYTDESEAKSESDRNRLQNCTTIFPDDLTRSHTDGHSISATGQFSRTRIPVGLWICGSSVMKKVAIIFRVMSLPERRGHASQEFLAIIESNKGNLTRKDASNQQSPIMRRTTATLRLAVKCEDAAATRRYSIGWKDEVCFQQIHQSGRTSNHPCARSEYEVNRTSATKKPLPNGEAAFRENHVSSSRSWQEWVSCLRCVIQERCRHGCAVCWLQVEISLVERTVDTRQLLHHAIRDERVR
jgi:hypothetical protein